MKVCCFPIVLLVALWSSAQSLHPLEAAKNHYAELQKLDATPTALRSSMDKQSFTPDQYNSLALAYTLMEPAYLSQDQAAELKKSVQFPANSSDQTRAELDFLLEWQKKRTPEEIHRTSKVLAPIGYWPHINVKKDHEGYEENIRHLMFEGREVLGERCTAFNYPDTFKLLQGITRDMRIMEFTVK